MITGTRSQVVFEVTAPAARDTLYLDLLRRFSGMDLNHGHVVVLSPQLVSQILQVWGQVCATHDVPVALRPRHLALKLCIRLTPERFAVITGT
jgi:hypothetical protein